MEEDEEAGVEPGEPEEGGAAVGGRGAVAAGEGAGRPAAHSRAVAAAERSGRAAMKPSPAAGAAAAGPGLGQAAGGPDARWREKGEAEAERQRTRERLEATLAGLGELEYLRQRQELLVKSLLLRRAPGAQGGRGEQQGEGPPPRSLEEKFLEENILLLRRQLVSRARGAGAGNVAVSRGTEPVRGVLRCSPGSACRAPLSRRPPVPAVPSARSIPRGRVPATYGRRTSARHGTGRDGTGAPALERLPAEHGGGPGSGGGSLLASVWFPEPGWRLPGPTSIQGKRCAPVALNGS